MTARTSGTAPKMMTTTWMRMTTPGPSTRERRKKRSPRLVGAAVAERAQLALAAVRAALRGRVAAAPAVVAHLALVAGWAEAAHRAPGPAVVAAEVAAAERRVEERPPADR